MPAAGAGNARRRLLAAFVALFACAACRLAGAAERPEHEVKAAFLYNFGKYVRWPKTPARQDNTFVIAILGNDPFGSALDDIVSGNRIEDRRIEVKRVSTPKELGPCDVLYISESEAAHLERILAALPKAPILTVSDIPRFVERGGMIGLVMANRRVRFEVNLQATEEAGLDVGSQLLRLARAVIEPRAR